MATVDHALYCYLLVRDDDQVTTRYGNEVSLLHALVSKQERHWNIPYDIDMVKAQSGERV